MRDRHDPSGPVDIETDVVRTGKASLPGMEADAKRHLDAFGPSLKHEAALDGDCSRNRALSSWEDSEERIALGTDLHAVLRGERVTDDLSMALQDIGIGISKGLEQARRPLDVAEEEGHRPRRSVNHCRQFRPARPWRQAGTGWGLPGDGLSIRSNLGGIRPN
jgi:hypothetical protein